MTTQLTPQKNRVWEALLLGTLVGAAALLPYVFFDKGLFLYYGDFNVQQIPFYQLANDAVRSGNIWWSWKTDLGANFIGSYSFYLLFSPFFWLSLLFPPAATPYLMAPLLALKLGCAAATGYLYLKRFLRDQQYAVLFSLLYAFSGYSVYNIFFNHFHEAIIFFPLLLIGLEQAMTEQKWGRFALAITVNAVVNYWFFIGEAVFVALYFVVRFTDRRWRLTWRRFWSLGCEAVLGLGMAMAALLPSVLAILGNPRTTGENLLLGNNLWYYSNPQRYLGIIHSVLFTPDMPALNNWFPDHGAQWSSLSAYLPFFSTAGVIAYLLARRRDWLGRMIIASGIFAMVPVLNHLFVLENYSYYARWFYMPTLLMVLATAKAVENQTAEGDIPFHKGYCVTLGAMMVLLVIAGLTPSRSGEEWKLGIYKYPEKFLATAAITLVGFLAVGLLMRAVRSPKFRDRLTAFLVVGCFLYTFFALMIGKATYSDNRWITETALPGRDQMSMDAPGEFSRSDIYKGNDNLGMYWNLPNIQTFHSIVPASLMEFYPAVGVKRDVSSKPETKFPELRSLLSVRWLYIDEQQEEQNPMPGYTLADTRLGYNIYQNDNFIPMGFAYDYCMNPEDWDNIDKESRARALLYAVYLDKEAIERNSDILEPVAGGWRGELSYRDFGVDAQDRANAACVSFATDNKGFTATTAYTEDELVFFSVPYDKGWRATVNGQPAPIERANLGFMAVRVPGGESTLRFEYTTPGLWLGVTVTVVSLLLFAGYLLLRRRLVPEPDEDSWEQTCIKGFDEQPWD
ncbi:MAG: YfhO family protein [Angelakisella sp.]